MAWQPVIGLEVHAQLSTNTKMFCSCKREFGAEPNTHVCPVCLGMPGTLPVPNAKAVEYAVRMGLATNCYIDQAAMFTRKNYFYPDLPKGYQITQQGEMAVYDRPVCKKGWLDIDLKDGSRKRIGITRIHMEEDAGKLIHDQTVSDSLFDANRCGTPLIEIVSDPDLRNAEEVIVYLEKVKQILEYLDISDADMEKGNFRCDVNVSIRKNESDPFGERVELKNMNSFSNIVLAIESEMQCQIRQLEKGEVIKRQTKKWDPVEMETIATRSKEDAQDYRYFPEPDLVPLKLESAWIESVKAGLPELPEAKRARYVDAMGLSPYDAQVLTSDKSLSIFFEEAAKNTVDKKTVANWMMGEVLRLQKDKNISIAQMPFPPAHLGELVTLIHDGVISGKIAKQVFEEMSTSGKAPSIIVEEKGLKVITDNSAIEVFIHQVIEKNPSQVAEYRSGKVKMFGFFVGQIMKLCQGKASPEVVNELLKKALEG